MSKQTIPTVELNNGVEMPILGFGVFQIPAEETEQAVLERSAAGYGRSTPPPHTATRKQVGRAIAASGIPRGELFITTKLWIQKQPGEEQAPAGLRGSLERLGLDYVDLYLIHQPLGDYYGSWRAMQDANREGLARRSACRTSTLTGSSTLIDHNEMTPAVEPDREPPVLPAHRRPGADARARRPDRILGPVRRGQERPVLRPMLSEIGAAHGKSVAQVVLRWLIQRDVIVIPKSVRPERMRENIDVFDFELTDRRDGTDRGARHRRLAVLRPPRPRHGQPVREPPCRVTNKPSKTPRPCSSTSPAPERTTSTEGGPPRRGQHGSPGANDRIAYLL